MTDRNYWHGEDAFWELFEPLLFSERRQLLAVEQVNKIAALLQIEDKARILDLCCGNGRHSLVLSERGYLVTGVDRTEQFLEAAQREARQRGLNVRFVVADMRDYRAPNHYDIALNLFGSFGYFEDLADDRKVLENLYDSLRPRGKLLIETMGKEILARHLQPKDWDENGELLILSEKQVTQDWSRVETRWIAIRDNERIEYRVSVRAYAAAELSSLLADCGFSAIQVYGSLEGRKYDQEAQRLVLVAQK